MRIDSRGSSKGCLASVVVMVNRDDVFERDLLAAVAESIDYIDLVVIRGAPSGAAGLNAGIDRARADIIMCAHQDVFLRTGWLARLHLLLGTAPKPWGVCGAAGVMTGGEIHGTHSGLGMGEAPNLYRHVEVQTLDESCLILYKPHGLRFDDSFGYFHMYGADICLQAAERGLAVFVIDLPMEHRTQWTAGPGFGESAQRLKAKWGHKVPVIHTTAGIV